MRSTTSGPTASPSRSSRRASSPSSLTRATRRSGFGCQTVRDTKTSGSAGRTTLRGSGRGAGARATVLKLEGSGEITHLAFELIPPLTGSLRQVVVELYYDGAAAPSLRLPLTELQFAFQHSVAVRRGQGPVPAVYPPEFVNFDITLAMIETEGALQIDCGYDSEIFDAATIARWIGHFRTLLEAIAAAPETPIGELPLDSADERR